MSDVYVAASRDSGRLPIGIFLCDQLGRITEYDGKSVELWGRAPPEGKLFSGAHESFHLDGSEMPPAETPVAEALRTGAPVRDREFVIERADGSHALVCADTVLLFDDDGELARRRHLQSRTSPIGSRPNAADRARQSEDERCLRRRATRHRDSAATWRVKQAKAMPPGCG